MSTVRPDDAVPSYARAAVDAGWGPEATHRLEAYAELLATDGVTRGLIGPREVPRLWDRHLLNSAALVALLPSSDEWASSMDVCDVGSGAGLPGLVIACLRPDLSVTLLEPLLRRTTFLTEAVERLRLRNVEVLRGRAEELAGRRRWAVVTARAVAPLDRLARWCLPLVAADGELLAMKGSSAPEEVAAALPGLSTLRTHLAGDPDVISCATPGTSDTTFVVRFRTVGLVPAARPRSSRTSTKAGHR